MAEAAHAATLTYGGADISSANGTMTVTCGSLWELSLVRNTNNGQQGGTITTFDDLTDSGDFSYCTDSTATGSATTARASR